MTDGKRETSRSTARDEALKSGNPPVAPVEDFDLAKVGQDRRMFGNGDTDREDRKPR